MGAKLFLSLVFIIFVLLLLLFYWFIPFGTSEFSVKLADSNSNITSPTAQAVQFYPNMRYSDLRISYKISDDCTLQKKNDMNKAFGILSGASVLNFYPVVSGEQISVNCQSKSVLDEGLFIAGEGGPVNISRAGKYNVIFNGKILLIRGSSCPDPNIALHELLHALGFDHVDDRDNIMYSVSNCGQTLGQEIPKMINELYSAPSHPDLAIENVSAVMRGRYLDLNMSIRNNGLNDAGAANIIISADGDSIKEINLDALEIGYGRSIILKNIWTKKINVDQLELFIDSSFSELSKDNNRVVLEISD
jgi:hypothetical protein